MSENQGNMFSEMIGRLAKAMQIRDFIIHNVSDHEKDIARVVIDNFGISRVTASRHLNDLIQEGTLAVRGKTKDRVYSLIEQVDKIIPLQINSALEEDVVWTEQIKPLIAKDAKQNVLDICAHGITEMVNNVIDHSGSSTAEIVVKKNAARIEFWVVDHGVGIFRKIQQACNLQDLPHAILELAKGKLTTSPEKHSGEGIFFTSRMFDEFMIISDNIDFMRSLQRDWIFETKAHSKPGTSVNLVISTRATQTVREIMDQYRGEFDAFAFSKTIIPVKLMECEGEKLISRSQAKRLLSRIDKFQEVWLDFKGITEIGQAFADEIFRVYRKANPQVHITEFNASDEVKEMISRAITASESSPGEPLFSS